MSDTLCSLCGVSLRLPRKHEKITPVMKASFPITIMHHRTTSQALLFGFAAKKDRGMGFSVLAEQEMIREPKNERGCHFSRGL